MPERKCGTCVHQVEWGCEAFRFRESREGELAEDSWVKPAYMHVTIDGEDIYHCPRQTLHQQPKQWSRLLQFYHLYKSGHLPDPGAVVEQSNVLMEAFRIIDAISDEIDTELQTKANRKKGEPRGPQ